MQQQPDGVFPALLLCWGGNQQIIHVLKKCRAFGQLQGGQAVSEGGIVDCWRLAVALAQSRECVQLAVELEGESELAVRVDRDAEEGVG